MKQRGLFDEIERLQKISNLGDPLEKLNKVIKWDIFRPTLNTALLKGVTTYGDAARAAGIPNGTRQVVRVLHSRSEAANLPWHRLLSKGAKPGTGRIALQCDGFEEQKELLLREGVEVSPEGVIDLGRYGYIFE